MMTVTVGDAAATHRPAASAASQNRGVRPLEIMPALVAPTKRM
jgi:hypothetical protein